MSRSISRKSASRPAAILALLLGVVVSAVAWAAPQRELVYMSRLAIRDLVGCEWGDGLYHCGHEDFARNRLDAFWGRPALGFWKELCLRDFLQDRPWYECRFAWASKAKTPGALILLVGDRNLTAAYRVREAGETAVIEEYRPFFEKGALEPREYAARRVVRRQRSSDPEDIRSYRTLYPASSELRQRLGVAWGNSSRQLRDAFRRRAFVPDQMERLAVLEEWRIPQFADLARDAAKEGKRGPASILSWEDWEVYLFRNREASVVRIAFFGNDAVQAILEYSQDGKAEFLNPPKASQIRWALAVKWGHRWSEIFEGEPRQALVDPEGFFSTWGEPFGDWRARFAARRSKDKVSWTDHHGRRYSVAVEPRQSWNNEDAGNWDVLEFEADRLTAIYSHDVFGREVELRPWKIEAGFWRPPSEPRSGFFLPAMPVRFSKGGLAVTLALLTACAAAIDWIGIRIGRIPVVRRRLDSSIQWFAIRLHRLRRR